MIPSRLLLMSVAAFAALLGASCADDATAPGDMTLQEYFTEVEAIFENASRGTEQLNQELNDSLSSAKTFEEQVEALQAFVSGAADVFDESISQMESLSPPVEVEQPHNDFTEATADVLSAATDLNEGLANSEDESDATGHLEEFESSIAEPLFTIDEACSDLQDIADDNSINTDLRCTEQVFPERPQDPF
ncbi:MAG: hypothetical protein ABIP58_08925 [Dehalococcoidia bacterium]